MGSCNLGSINLSALVHGKGIDKRTFDFKELKRVVRGRSLSRQCNRDGSLCF